ncbi:S-methyl-5'-thioinosine phosphorylase [Zooshikella ganghwensis]|uniref:S-methyl-5'-thioinosine phosphorylase n=1 Tax=Zooshikella ganghwensis TaxID=202772 RepID=UPI000413857D|nr:S-methyl-5'-thioinosine phosphorylase [Zooshikella ganghwensis]
MPSMAVIGGTGLTQWPELELKDTVSHETVYGNPSAPITIAKLGNVEVAFLARHGCPHQFAPHRINYRANIAALKKLGVNQIFAVNAVGSICSEIPPESIVIPDQVIDYTYGREHTFFPGDDQPVHHIDFTEPFSPNLRDRLLQTAQDIQLSVTKKAVYGCTQGPRLETVAEINRLERDGVDIVGMTAMPEAALAREMEMDYASIALVVNMAAGRSSGIITMDEIELALAKGMQNVKRLLLATLNR